MPECMTRCKDRRSAFSGALMYTVMVSAMSGWFCVGFVAKLTLRDGRRGSRLLQSKIVFRLDLPLDDMASKLDSRVPPQRSGQSWGRNSYCL